MICARTVLTIMLALPLAGVAQATDFSRGAIEKVSPYKNLPGVKQPKDAANAAPAEDCTSDIEMRRYYRDGSPNLLDEPVRIYRCKRDGVTIESTQDPRSGQWPPPGTKDAGWPWGR